MKQFGQKYCDRDNFGNFWFKGSWRGEELIENFEINLNYEKKIVQQE